MVIVQSAKARWSSLGRRTLIGRAEYAGLRLPHPAVGQEQALIWFADDRLDGEGEYSWYLRALGTTNPTKYSVGATMKKLPPGEDVRLDKGVRVQFGTRQEVWELVETGPPAPAAVRQRDGALRTGDESMLVLPVDGDPLCSVRWTDGRWVGPALAERDAEGVDLPLVDPSAELHLRDQHFYRIGVEWYRLLLPSMVAVDATATASIVSNRQIKLELALGFADSLVEATLIIDGVRTSIGASTHLGLLAPLVRARIADEVDGTAAAEQGWVEVERLCRKLRESRRNLNLWAHRTNEDFAQLGLPPSEVAVEVRKVREKHGGQLVWQRRLRVDRVGVQPPD